MVFFFFKQKTAYEMRISDWSSDVCSSDLRADGVRRAPPVRRFWAKMLGPVGVASPDRKIAHARAAADPGQPEIEEARFPEAEHHARDMNDQRDDQRSAEHTSELQSLMRISYADFCLKNNTTSDHSSKIRNT